MAVWQRHNKMSIKKTKKVTAGMQALRTEQQAEKSN
jgi:hypothetical protein